MREVVATAAHTVPDRPPIQLAVGDSVTVGERDRDWPAFVFVTADAGAGWVPARHLSSTDGVASVILDYDTTELATEVGDVLEVLAEDLESGWLWCRAASRMEGWVPIATLADTDDSAGF